MEEPYLCSTANMSRRMCVVVQQMQYNQSSSPLELDPNRWYRKFS